VTFPFLRWGPYRFFHYLPSTVYYGSFITYYDYAYVVTTGTNIEKGLEELEAA